MKDISIYLGRKREKIKVPDRKNARTTNWRLYLVVSAPSARVLNICEAINVPLLDERVDKIRSFDGEPLPPSVYLSTCRH